jgi:Tfp pilus assembly protein PilF
MRRLIALAALLMLGACNSQPVQNPLQNLWNPSKGTAALSAGLKEYENGQYAEASRNLQAAMDLGLTDRERADAHKHLAFIHCSSGRERACREEFRKALGVNPDLELAPAEAGHPVWGPLFAQLKGSPAPLKLALEQYEAGDYPESAKNFHSALREGLADKERANAHKHLAFIHCASSRERLCRDEFRRALAVDPALDLEPAEAGHPVWGPIFRAVKAGQ